MTKCGLRCSAKNYLSFLFLISFLWNCHLASAANILAVFPSVWKSHYLFGCSLLEQLVQRHNHTVTLVSGYAAYSPSESIREIKIDGIHQNWIEMGLSFDVERIREKSIMERFTRLIYAGTTNADLLLSDRKIKQLIRSEEKFDLLIVDLFLSDSLLGLSHYYKIPTVVVSPNGANTWLDQMAGNPHNSALDPSNFLAFLEKMTMWERSVNTLMGVFEKLTYNFFHMITQQAVYKKHFEPLAATATETTNEIILPHHRELTHNLSIVLINSHPIVQYPRAYLPNMIEIGGAHLQTEISGSSHKLPEHLRKFIEDATDGVIYMSLGANIRTADLSREKLDSLLHVFESLESSMRVLLKWEDDQIDVDLPSNVMINDWFPQQSILAHDNVKIFITTAGLMSTIEAIHYRTPMIIIPIYPEQEVNAKRLQNYGCAVQLPFDLIGYHQMLNSIDELRQNQSYMQNIQRIASLLDVNSPVEAPLAKALHYIEIVLKTAGASHLKSHANHLGFLKTELVDVLLIILAGICCIIAVPFLVTCCILRKSYYSYVNNAIRMRNKNSTEIVSSDVQLVTRRRSSSTTGSVSSSASSSTSNCQKEETSVRNSQCSDC